MKDKLELSSELENKLRSHLRSKKPLFGTDSPFSGLLQSMVNTMLEGEMEDHLKQSNKLGKKNKRNGYSNKKVISEEGELYISTPRDRDGSFKPEIIEKRERQLSSGLDKQILALYAQGNSIEDVRRLLLELYSVEISAGKISAITDKVLPEIQQWRDRQLRAFYPILYLDAIHFKVRHEGKYSSQAFYTAYAVDWGGNRDLLGMYVSESEGANTWGMVLQDLKKRGVADVLVVCVDDLTGFSGVIKEEFPQSIIQKCIVHQIRNSLKYVQDKEKKKVAGDLKKIYTAATRQAGEDALKVFDQKWGKKYKYIVEQWTNKWDELTAFFDFQAPLRRMIYTTNPVEALHRIIRKLIKGKAAWSSRNALIKQLYLSLMQNKKSWKRKAYNWKSIQLELLNQYPERIKPHID